MAWFLIAVLFGACASPTGSGSADTTPPANVTALAATPGDGKITLSWTAPADADFALVEISAPGLVTVTVPAGTNSREITGLANGTF
jgi:hypothetical protein